MLTISGLTYRIGGRTLLNEASAQIPAGSKVGLVGRNGVGKSTLLALIRCAAQPDGGAVRRARSAAARRADQSSRPRSGAMARTLSAPLPAQFHSGQP